MQQKTTKRKVSTEALVNMLLFSETVNDSGRLKLAVEQALRSIFPPEMCQGMLDASAVAIAALPHKATLSRFKLSLDVGFMLFYRLCNMKHQEAGTTQCKYLVWDSSPQFNRDYELALVESVAEDDLRRAWCLISSIYSLSSDRWYELLEDEGLQEEHHAHIQCLKSMMHTHALPCSFIGFGSSSFSHKVAALMHTMRLEHFSHKGLATYCSEILGVLSDDGTESLLHRVRPIDLERVCPYFESTSKLCKVQFAVGMLVTQVQKWTPSTTATQGFSWMHPWLSTTSIRRWRTSLVR